jgi:hypothetical protein
MSETVHGEVAAVAAVAAATSGDDPEVALAAAVPRGLLEVLEAFGVDLAEPRDVLVARLGGVPR